MAITDEQLSAVRAYLARDTDAAEQLLDRLQQSGRIAGFSTLISLAFIELAERRFGENWTVAEITRFVARARIRFGRDRPELDPHIAERLLRAALGDTSAVAGIDEHAKADTQFIVLNDLLDDAKLDELELDELLTRIGRRAELPTDMPGG